MASNAKTIKDASGAIPKAADVGYGPPSTPADIKSLEAAVLQLQNTVNEIIARFNVHTHVENTAGAYTQNASTAAPAGGLQVQGVIVAATTKFTDS